jgi:hypothetical protein
MPAEIGHFARSWLMRSMGVIDYTRQDFAKALSGYDVVLNSPDADTLRRSLGVLKPGGHLISISGPPDPGFADERGLSIVPKTVLRALSFGIRRASRTAGVHYPFLFMRADGSQLAQITSLVEQGVIKPVIDRIFQFAETPRRWPTWIVAAPGARSWSAWRAEWHRAVWRRRALAQTVGTGRPFRHEFLHLGLGLPLGFPRPRVNEHMQQIDLAMAAERVGDADVVDALHAESCALPHGMTGMWFRAERP